MISDVMNQKYHQTPLQTCAGICQTGQSLGLSQEHVKVDFENGKALAVVHGLHGSHRLLYMLRGTGMWDGHLKAVIALLNLFAATGHTHYAKSARLYV